MRFDLKVAAHFYVSAAFLSVCMMLAPEVLHLGEWARLLGFSIGLGGAIFFGILGFRAAIRDERLAPNVGHRRRMLAIYGMVFFGAGFLGCAAWYFWPQSPRETAAGIDTKPEPDKPLGELLLECQQASLPEVGLPNQTALTMISPFRFDDVQGGTVGFSGMPMESGQPIPWPAEWKGRTASSAQCRLTNYGATTLFNVELPFKISFVRITRGEQPGNHLANQVINVAEGSLPITKIEPGNGNAYIFYIHNQGRDVIRPEFSGAATCVPLGATARRNVSVIQPTSQMRRYLALWPIHSPEEIIAEEEKAKLEKNKLEIR